MKILGLFCGYIFVSTFGLLLIKQASNIWSWRFVSGFAMYAVGFTIWLFLLRKLPLSVAFPSAAGALIATTTIVGHVWLGERLSSMQVIGVATIGLGIVLVFYRATIRW